MEMLYRDGVFLRPSSLRDTNKIICVAHRVGPQPPPPPSLSGYDARYNKVTRHCRIDWWIPRGSVRWNILHETHRCPSAAIRLCICLWVSPTWPLDGAVWTFHSSTGRLQSDKMNMYAVPSPGIPGCPPGLEYLTQVSTVRCVTQINYILYNTRKDIIHVHTLLTPIQLWLCDLFFPNTQLQAALCYFRWISFSSNRKWSLLKVRFSSFVPLQQT